jgi:hypothetical protein
VTSTKARYACSWDCRRGLPHDKPCASGSVAAPHRSNQLERVILADRPPTSMISPSAQFVVVTIASGAAGTLLQLGKLDRSD